MNGNLLTRRSLFLKNYNLNFCNIFKANLISVFSVSEWGLVSIAHMGQCLLVTKKLFYRISCSFRFTYINLLEIDLCFKICKLHFIYFWNINLKMHILDNNFNFALLYFKNKSQWRFLIVISVFSELISYRIAHFHSRKKFIIVQWFGTKARKHIKEILNFTH